MCYKISFGYIDIDGDEFLHVTLFYRLDVTVINCLTRCSAIAERPRCRVR